MSSTFHVSGPHGAPGGPVTLLNGHTEPRVKSSEGCTVLPCGCAFTDWPSEWRQMCAPSAAEHFARHADALRAHGSPQSGSAQARTAATTAGRSPPKIHNWSIDA